jgi:uncharacterized protein YjeT (DUF2065 family)
MEREIEYFMAVAFTVVGLSHVLWPREWVEFFLWLRTGGVRGVFANGMLSLAFGALVVAFHDSWSGAASVITALGWLQVLKGAISLLAPRLAMRSLERVSTERAHEFQIAGAVLVGLGLFAGYLAWQRSPAIPSGIASLLSLSRC